jgi:hypothetical protein
MGVGLLDKLNFKKLFKRDKVFHENVLFVFHHQVNFVVILIGIIFIFSQRYLGEEIECTGPASSYDKKVCLMYGAKYVNENNDLASRLPGGCSVQKNDETDKNITAYYIWVPFVLLTCLFLVKIPRFIWKNLIERGTLECLVEVKDDKPEEEAEKIVQKLQKLRKRSVGAKYHLGFAFCEFLNLVMVLACFFLVDGLLSNKFADYAISVKQFYSSSEDQKSNPMCMAFPTFVNCEIYVGAITEGTDKNSHLCILPHNLWNQYYFLVLWIWWVFLITVSSLGLVYRLAGIMVAGFSREVLNLYLTPLGMFAGKGLQIDPKREMLASDYFVISRMVPNMKKSLTEELLKKLKPKKGYTEEKMEADKLVVEMNMD